VFTLLYLEVSLSVRTRTATNNFNRGMIGIAWERLKVRPLGQLPGSIGGTLSVWGPPAGVFQANGAMEPNPRVLFCPCICFLSSFSKHAVDFLIRADFSRQVCVRFSFFLGACPKSKMFPRQSSQPIEEKPYFVDKNNESASAAKPYT